MDTELRGIQETGKDVGRAARAEGTHAGARHPRAALAEGPLDLVALRIALHGWWFGQPVVPAPLGHSTEQYASELAEQGAHAGTVVVAAGLPKPAQAGYPQVLADGSASVTLIIRPPLPLWLGAALTGVAALESVADAAAGCTLRWPCVVADGKTWVFSGAVVAAPAYTLMTLAANLPRISAWSQPDQSSQPDRGELLIARWLHRVEGWYRALESAEEAHRQAIRALAVQWLNQVELPAEGITILEQGQPLQAEALTLDEQGEVVVCLRDGTRRPLPAGTFTSIR